MKHPKRILFRQGLVGTFLLGASTIAQAALPDPVKPETPKAISPFHLGMAGYTFANFNLDTTLRTLERLDIHYFCVKDFHSPSNNTDGQVRASHDEYTAHKATRHVVGPIYMKSEGEVDHTFDYAKRVGVKLVVGILNYELLPYADKKVKEYDFHYAIHLHGPDVKTYPDATDVWGCTKDLNPRIGMYLDVGHGLRNGCDLIADLKKYHTRVSDIYTKGAADSSKAGVGIEIGCGKIDPPASVRMMREANYTGMCNLEYKKDMKDPLLGIVESIGCLKAVSDLA